MRFHDKHLDSSTADGTEGASGDMGTCIAVAPVATACAYDTAIFNLRGRSPRINFRDEIPPLAALSIEGSVADTGGGAMSASSI